MDKNAFIRLCKNKYGDRFDYTHLPESIKRAVETIICKKHGKLELIPRDHLRSKHGCPHCASEYVIKPTERINRGFIQKAKKKHRNGFDYSLVELETEPGAKVDIVCPEHGVIKVTLKSHLHSKTGCWDCGFEKGTKKRVKYNTLDDVIKEAVKAHGERYTYLNYDRVNRTVTYLCVDHGKVVQGMDQHFLGKGCSRCFYDGFRITPESFMERVHVVHPEGYTYDLIELRTVNQNIEITHECGRVYSGRVSNHLNGQGCMRCKSSSFGEDRIRDYLKLNQVEAIEQYRIEGYPYRYDFYIPEINVLVEYDGQQHFKPVEFFGGVKALRETKRRDRLKNKIASRYGYTLIRLNYKQFDNIEVCLSRALDTYFRYRVNGVFYSKVTEVSRTLGLPGTTTMQELDSYRTFNVLRPA